MDAFDLRVPPSREVMRELLMDTYAKDGVDGLALVLDYIVQGIREQVSDALPQATELPEPDWVIHYVPGGVRCCHIHMDQDVETVWQGAADSISAAMVLAIEDFIDWCRGDGLPSIGDRG